MHRAVNQETKLERLLADDVVVLSRASLALESEDFGLGRTPWPNVGMISQDDASSFGRFCTYWYPKRPLTQRWPLVTPFSTGDVTFTISLS